LLGEELREAPKNGSASVAVGFVCGKARRVERRPGRKKAEGVRVVGGHNRSEVYHSVGAERGANNAPASHGSKAAVMSRGV
jgi:hypothetical protein